MFSSGCRSGRSPRWAHSAIIAELGALPPRARRTITHDNGGEFAQHEAVTPPKGSTKAAAKAGATPSEGYDYYMTARAGAETYPNYSHLSPSFMLEAPMLADAMSYAPYIYTPFIGIVGERAMDPASGALCTGPLTKAFFDKASEPKAFVEIEGASHVSLYDNPEDVHRAIDAMDGFSRTHGGAMLAAA